MKTATFDLEEKRLKEEIRKRKAKRVLIQLPEGLKPYGPYLASIVEKTGTLAIISADPCYGACDLATSEAESLDADLIVHYGHSKMYEGEKKIKTLYIEAKAKSSVKDAVKKALPLLKAWKKIGLVTTVQHVHVLDEARKELLNAGKTVTIGDVGHVKYAGQVTGCDLSNARAVSKEVDAFLFVGGGKFHPIGVALATAKPTVLADPYEKTASTIEKEVNTILKQRWAQICLARKAEKVGVLVGLKSGQRKLEMAMKVKQKLEETGKQTVLLALREITPEALLQFPDVEAFVNTACPRVSLDDAQRFNRPVITFNEAQVVLGEMSWEELCRRGWFENLT
jgi:2-(3-amino-3-carboxypropyl)histidine synthase